MDRNTITGLVVIALILIGYSYFMSPSKEELKAMHVRDSIARVEAQRAAALEKERQADFAAQQQNTETQQAGTEAIFKQDSLPVEQYTLENNKIKLHINTKGGCIDYVDLKGYRTHDSLPLILWKDHKSSMGLNFYARNKQINTADLIFVPNTNQKELNAEGAEQVLTMRAYVDENKYLEFEYKLAPDSYMVDFNINTYNLNDVIASNTNFLTLYWGVDMPQLEKSRDFESRYTGVYYNFSNNDVEHLSLTGDEKVDLPTSVKWVAYKQQFFSSVLIANESFPNVLVSTANNTTPGFLKTADAEISLPYSGKAIEKYDMRFYFGPNSYPTLREYGKDIELPKLVDLGWKWIAWFNRYVVIPIFNFLETNVTLNYGLIIFLLTLIIKLVLFPLTYTSYMSQAKMRVLKPQIDEINKKIPADKAMERQQAVMKLYKKAGVNPMGGCLPMLLQTPILIALFYFFPGAIELRLFCLLMTITNILYMWYNSKNQPQNDQMKGMQTMMYIMPIMFLFIFNSYSSGLSYYYFIATLITIVQTWAIRKFVNDEKLLKQIELAKTKPVKKSKFQQKLEEMQRMQEQRMKQMPKKK